jgi:NTE family protein
MPLGTSEALLEAHRGMLIGGLTSIFGDFNQEMLQHVLPRVEWTELGGGEVLFRQHDQDESLFFVVSGRLRAFTVDEAGTRTVLGEIARGETVGEMAFFTGEPRTATVAAVRDSVLARFSKEVFRELLLAYPLVSLNMTRLVIERLKRATQSRPPVVKPVTIGVVAITPQVDAQAFAATLAERLMRHGKTVVITSQSMDERLGYPGAAQARLYEAERARRVTVTLEQIESDHQFVLFVADPTPTEWTRRCMRHCDELLLVADADQPPALHPIEVECLGAAAGDRGEVNKLLVLLHPDDRLSPTGTRRWLEGRALAGHIHVRRTLARDWQRLGRVVSGNTVGLVLSGGGARGFAHLGVLKAIEEAGIDYDLAAGTSIGAVMAAYAAMDLPMEQVIRAARTAFKANPTGDFNFVPLVSLIGGKRLKQVIDSAVVESRGQHIDIEDLWKGYFCVSSNYSTAREAVLTHGHLAKSIRASVSIPGALPPVMLGGELHIDGGSFNNFPTDVMGRKGAARIIGVNLLRERDVKYDLEDVPGWFELLRDKLRGGSKKYRLPSLTSLLLNTSTMYSYARQQQSQADVDLYFAPGVDQYGMLEWSQFDRIVEAGYQHGLQQLQQAGETQIAQFRHV